MHAVCRDWRVKSLVQRAISWLPASPRWNELFQRYVTRGLDLRAEGEFLGKLRACQKHYSAFRRFAPGHRNGFTVLELGTGWFPVIPIGLYLCGASPIWTFDIVPLMNRRSLRLVLQRFTELEYHALRDILPDANLSRLERVRSLLADSHRRSPSALLQTLGIHAIIDDVAQHQLPEDSLSLVFSNGVLEHLDRNALLRVFQKFKRLLEPHGIMSHYVGMADQYASFDPRITPFNFMRYSARAWRIWNNSIIPQNRLRLSDYRSLLHAAGFALVDESNTLGSIDDLRQVPLAPEFQSYSPEDLLVLYSHIIATPSAP